MNYDSLLKELTIGLQEAGVKNMNLDTSLDPDEARAISMANVAKPIAKAIRNGVNFDIKGVATCAEISEMTSAGDVNDGDVWGVSDSGDVTQPDGSSLRVSAGDLLLFDGEKWNVFLHIDLSNYATKVELQNAVNLLSQLISSHTSRTDNPHEVTAHQVGAYTQQETEDRINDALSGEVGGWLGNLTVAEVNALTTHKKGDSATITDSGVVMPGNVSVNAGDEIMWVDSTEVWQKKIDSKGLFVVDGQLRYG